MNLMKIEARTDAQTWNEGIVFHAYIREEAFRRSARYLGLKGRVLSAERVGTTQWLVNVEGARMHVVVTP